MNERWKVVLMVDGGGAQVRALASSFVREVPAK